MDKLKVLVVDHSVINRKKITDLINETEYGMVVKSASRGEIALEWLLQCEFDVMLIDAYVVKEIDVETIATIRRDYSNIEIIIMSDQDKESAQLTLESMNRGAIDFIIRSSGASGDLDFNVKRELEAIFAQIKVKQFLPKDNVLKLESAAKVLEVKKPFIGEIDLVLIASSTGGPVALEEICKHFPENFNKAVLIVQHMPPEFTNVLATSLNKKYKAHFSEGKTGDLVKKGHFIIAPGGYHMVLDEEYAKNKAIKLIETSFVNGVRPSADVLFESVAREYRGKNILVVILTGMGNDGMQGVSVLKKACNCFCITQSEKTCVVYGMPKCVFNAGLSDEVVDLNNIALRINQMTMGGGGFGG